MALRALTFLGLVLVLGLCAVRVEACFGPKLFLGVPEDAEGQVLTSLVAIYIKEKTGVETERVPLEGRGAVAEITAENLDFGFADRPTGGLTVLLDVDGLPVLVSGPRIPNDLQFTTVGPALERLGTLLHRDDVASLARAVESGELPMAAARAFLMAKRWI